MWSRYFPSSRLWLPHRLLDRCVHDGLFGDCLRFLTHCSSKQEIPVGVNRPRVRASIKVTCDLRSYVVYYFLCRATSAWCLTLIARLIDLLVIVSLAVAKHLSKSDSVITRFCFRWGFSRLIPEGGSLKLGGSEETFETCRFWLRGPIVSGGYVVSHLLSYQSTLLPLYNVWMCIWIYLPLVPPGGQGSPL